MARRSLRVLVFVPLLVGLLAPVRRAWLGFGRKVRVNVCHRAGSAIPVFEAHGRPGRSPRHSDVLTAQAVHDTMGLADGGAQRRIALLGGTLGTLGTVGGPSPASAEATRNMRTTLKLYAEGLQTAADQLVFGMRPRIEQEDWPWLREYLRGDSYGNSKGYLDLAFPLDRAVLGNEDFLEGYETANLKMASLLQSANATAWDEKAPRREVLLKTWDDMAGLVGGVMTSFNNVVADEPELKAVSSFVPFALPAKDASQYGRSKEVYDERCTGILQSGICIDIPAGTGEFIAKNAQIGLSVNPLTAGSCVDGKCGGLEFK